MALRTLGLDTPVIDAGLELAAAYGTRGDLWSAAQEARTERGVSAQRLQRTGAPGGLIDFSQECPVSGGSGRYTNGVLQCIPTNTALEQSCFERPNHLGFFHAFSDLQLCTNMTLQRSPWSSGVGEARKQKGSTELPFLYVNVYTFNCSPTFASVARKPGSLSADPLLLRA